MKSKEDDFYWFSYIEVNSLHITGSWIYNNLEERQKRWGQDIKMILYYYYIIMSKNVYIIHCINNTVHNVLRKLHEFFTQ